MMMNFYTDGNEHGVNLCFEYYGKKDNVLRREMSEMSISDLVAFNKAIFVCYEAFLSLDSEVGCSTDYFDVILTLLTHAQLELSRRLVSGFCNVTCVVESDGCGV